MKLPENTEHIETELATLWMDEDGILVSISKSPTRTIENVSENLAAVRKITGNRRVPMMIYLSPSSVPDKETRKFVSKELPTVYKAMAMVSKSGLSKIIMNALFGLKASPIPMKTFSDDVSARQWLKNYL